MPDEINLDGYLTDQHKYLPNVALYWRTWTTKKPSWDHDHCEFCMAKFSNLPGSYNNGWATEDNYRWICDRCRAHFQDRFNWKLHPAEGATTVE